MQYKVPQNVDIEDQVIGSLTLRQFMIILVAVGIDLVLYFLIPSVVRPIFWMLALLITGLAIVVGFVKYGDQNMEIFLLSALKTIQLPRIRVWRKDYQPATHKESAVSVAKPEARKKSVAEARSSLQKLAEVVDSGGGNNFESGARMTVGVQEPKSEDVITPDILKKAEDALPRIEGILSKAKPAQREPVISEVASVSPNKEFNWPTIKKL